MAPTNTPPFLSAPVSRRAVVGASLAAAGVLALGGFSPLRPAKTLSALADEATVQDTLTIGVVNFQPLWGDVEANVAAMQGYIDEAHAAGVDLLLLPEMCVTGYAYSEDESDEESLMAVEAAETVDGPTAQAIAALAVEYGMWIVYGGTEVIEGDPDHAYNSAFACSPEGSVATYQKIHPVEGAWCVPGETPMILQTAWGPVGVNICYDTYAIPELERYYASQGCRLLLNPTATSRGFDAETGDSTLWRWYFESRIENIAMREQMFVASANLAEDDGGHYTFPGGSCVIGPTGSDGTELFCETVVGSTSDAQAGLHVGEIDLALAARTDIVDSAVFRAELFEEWYADLADDTDEDLAAAPEETAVVVGTVNFQPTFGDKEANFQSMSSYIEEAASAGVGLLVFPELALTGYAWSDEEGAANGQAVVDLAEATDGTYASQISELAVEHDMYIVFGTTEPVDGDSEHAYNAAFVCTPEGGVSSYRKVAPVEGPWCVAGDEPLIVETPYGAMGLSICKDTYSVPELARYYAAKGCTFVVNPTARTGTDEGWAHLYENALANLADQDKLIVVSADLCGEDLAAPDEQASWDPYSGASVVAAPLSAGEDGSYVRTWGSFSSDPTATGLVVAEVDYADLWLGLGSAITYFNPALYETFYRGEAFENTQALVVAEDEAA